MSALPPKADIRGVTPAGGIFLTKPSSLWSSQTRSSAVRIFAGDMPMTRVCKTDQIRDAWAAGDRIGALRIAARFFDRSAATKMFQRGMNAYDHPQFYRQLGKEPQEVVTAALEVLAKRFDLR